MGDVTGPISSLPGSSHALPDGAMCDDHPKRKAVARIQGETDSFGCEMLDVCAECLAEIRKYKAENRTGMCEWCQREATDLRPARDYDEGMAGRIYEVCGACIKRRNDEAREEMSRYEDDDYIDEEDFRNDCSWDPDTNDNPPPPAPRQVGSGRSFMDSSRRQHVDSTKCWCKPQRSHTETAGHAVLIHRCHIRQVAK